MVKHFIIGILVFFSGVGVMYFTESPATELSKFKGVDYLYSFLMLGGISYFLIAVIVAKAHKKIRSKRLKW